MEKHINLIRHIAWQFHRRTGIEWQELFSQACLAYCECLKSYKKDKGAKTTWVYTAMKNDLINFCKREHRNQYPTGVDDWFEDSLIPMYEFFEQEMNLSEDTKEIIQMVREEPERYKGTPREVVGLIRNDLRVHKSWAWQRIWKGMSNLRVELTKETLHRTVWL